MRKSVIRSSIFVCFISIFLLSTKSIAADDYSSCFPSGLPGAPTGSSFTQSWRSFSNWIEVTAWRVQCGENDTAVILNVVAPNTNVVCGEDFTVVQNGVQYNSVKLVRNPGGNDFCFNLIGPVTLLIEQQSGFPEFDDDSTFSLLWQRVPGELAILGETIPPVTPPESDFVVSLEEPIDGLVHGGIGNLRGWAVAKDGIEKIEIYFDGKYMFDAPYGGDRTDVAAQFTDIIDSQQSGFSLAFGYSNLSSGTHTVTARATTKTGQSKESSSTFSVSKFHKDFIYQNDIVDTSGSQITSSGDEINLNNVTIDGVQYNLKLKWRTAEQGFEIIEIQ